MTTQAQLDGYVECSECGHVLEQHNRHGCPVCSPASPCPTRWTRADIMRVRRREGLPARWSPSRLAG